MLSLFNQAHLSGALRESDMASCIGYPLPGVLTKYRVFPASALIVCPDYLTPSEGACLPIAAVTAWTALNWMRPIGQHIGTLAPPDAAAKTVLLQGTGGVSVAGLQIAHAAGLRTIITSSSDEKLKRAKGELSADVGINYKTFWEWQEPVMDATGGRGADVVFETGGTRTIRKSFECVAFGGVINCIGYVSGKNEDDGKDRDLMKLNVNVLALRRNCTLRGIINGGKDRFEEMLGFFEKKKIRPVVDKEFAFEDAKDALKYLKEGKHFGKVVIRM